LAKRALKICASGLRFPAVKFITKASLGSLENYSRFIVKDLINHVQTSHVLVAQWDGYILNPDSWKPEWLDYDYIGAAWHDGVIGNGGFSLRSRRLLEALQDPLFHAPFYPEDDRICRDWREQLEHDYKIKFSPPEVAAEFSIEGGRYFGQFGFHSFLTRNLPDKTKPMIFRHSGDAGDIIYGLATIKALGGGVLYISNGQWDVRQKQSIESVANLSGLLGNQNYIWGSSFTDANLSHADYDLDKFRETIMGHPNSGSIFRHHLKSFGAIYPESEPWLKVDFGVNIPDRPIVVSRSARYHNDYFPWPELVKAYGKNMIFVGLKDEHEDFIARFGFVPRLETATLLDAARVISGSKLFIGNQSCPMAVALGLGSNAIQEVWEPDANCILERTNVLYLRREKPKVALEWVRKTLLDK
jgi:hypothetical protein